MKNLTRTLVVALFAGALVVVPSHEARAQSFWFNFVGGGANATGHLDTSDNGGGSFTAFSGTASVTGTSADGFYALVINGIAPACNTSSPGLYNYDNQLTPSQTPSISNCGLLFQNTTTNDLLNIYSENGSYTLAVSPGNQGYDFHQGGDFTVTTPEPSSMALLGTGLVGLVPMVRRRRRR